MLAIRLSFNIPHYLSINARLLRIIGLFIYVFLFPVMFENMSAGSSSSWDRGTFSLPKRGLLVIRL